jgi:hypothetical protein
MIFFLAMGEINPRDIHASADYFFEYLRIVSRRAECGDYLCSSRHGRDYCTEQRQPPRLSV